MRYIQADGDTFVRHLNSFEPTRFDATHKCLPSKLTEAEATLLGVHKLKLVTPPYHDPTTNDRVDGDAVLIGGVWTQGWEFTATSDAPDRLIAYRTKVQNANKAACTAHIYASYPIEIQASVANSVYVSATSDAYEQTMVDFIANSIAEENRVFDLLELALTVAQIDLVEQPTWPVGV